MRCETRGDSVLSAGLSRAGSAKSASTTEVDALAAGVVAFGAAAAGVSEVEPADVPGAAGAQPATTRLSPISQMGTRRPRVAIGDSMAELLGRLLFPQGYRRTRFER